MKTKLITWATALVLAGSAMTSAWADDATSKPTQKESPKPWNVLLIGNSQCPTIVNNQLLEKLAASDKGGRLIKVGGCIKGGGVFAIALGSGRRSRDGAHVKRPDPGGGRSVSPLAPLPGCWRLRRG